MNIGLVLPAHQQDIRHRCFHPAGDFSEFPPDAIKGTVLERFSEILREFPNHIAVKTPTSELTYQQLDEASDRVARAISARSSDMAAPVALIFPNGAAFVVASLGVLKAGRIQLSLESSFPMSRLQYVLKQSGADLLVANTSNLALARSLGAYPIVNIDEPGSADSAAPLNIPAKSADPVVIDYTSGSTGQPKGIVWSHAGLLHVTARHTNTSHICRHDRLVMFRASVRAYLSVLLNGGTFCPLDLAQENPGEVARFLETAGITIYRAAVSTFRTLINVLDEHERFASLRLILLFGEPVYRNDIEGYRRHFGTSCLLGSSLGCNEMDDYSYFFVEHNSPIGSDVVPGGYPSDDVDVVLINEAGRPVSDGESGEICIGANYIPGCYWRNDDATAAAFTHLEGVPTIVYRTGDLGRRINGCLFHLGRQDSQIKIRGFRVDVGSVEAALLAIDGVKQAVVADTRESEGNNRLVAYIVGKPGHPVDVAGVRDALGQDLPAYALPSMFVVVEAIPMTATGKIDRRRLPAPDRAQLQLASSFVQPRTETEVKLASIWSEVLGLTEVGVSDKFLELGGDSLRATQVIARVVERFQIRPQIRALLDASTITEMACVIENTNTGNMDAEDVETLLDQIDQLSEEEARALLGQSEQLTCEETR
ncbi:MAG: non-ribosomal peptide synthetase [Chthoniobacterales bacterium]